MSGDIAVSVKNISKLYRLFNSPEERLKEALNPFGKRYHQEFWALKDVSLDVPVGHTIGVVGRNGSGKSTLLQIISNVLKPTSGNIAVNGRVSALLELGAGFNPEFTGRENVILNGAIQGIAREEMMDRMSAIEEFAGVGEFFDQPVKVFSSGMFVRVAFAAAINLDPDILIIDEALSVGDAKFQNRCFQKIREFQESGVTIIFVTHAVETITKLCDYAILLEGGLVGEKGAPNDVCNAYFNLLFGSEASLPSREAAQSKHENRIDPSATEKLAPKEILDAFIYKREVIDVCWKKANYNTSESRTGNGKANIIDYAVLQNGDLDPEIVRSGGETSIYARVLFNEKLNKPVYGFTIKTIDGVKIFGTNTWLDNINVDAAESGDIITFRYEFDMLLSAGHFFITLAVSDRSGNDYVLADHRTDLIHLHVVSEKEGNNGLIEMDTSVTFFQSKVS